MARVRIQAERAPDHEPRGPSLRVNVMERNPENPSAPFVRDILEADPSVNENERMRDVLKYLLSQLNDPDVAEIHIVKG